MIHTVCFGEVLWDILPTGALPGGAPMNVAYHLNRLGKTAKIISRIGNDKNGEKLLNFMRQNQIDTLLVQQDDLYHTGTVLATEGDNHEMQYDIVKPVAYDFISYNNDAATSVADAQYFVFGSLAARHPPSYNSLLQYTEAARTKVLDLNIRPPHVQQDVAETLLRKADILKLNEQELDMVNEWYADLSLFEDKIRSISDRYVIDNIIVTRGSKGAAYFDGQNFFYQSGFEVKVADTIGSGDSFLAGFLGSCSEGSRPEECLAFACKLGSFVASQTGGCPAYIVNSGTIKPA